MQNLEEFHKEMNYIIISKQGLNTTKNKKGKHLSSITFKEGVHSIKININSSQDNKISTSNILQTISDYRKKINVIQKHKNNKFLKYNTSLNRQKYRKNKLIIEKIYNSNNSVEQMNDINKLEKVNLSNNNSENENNNDNITLDKNSSKDKDNQENTQVIVKNNNSLIFEKEKNNEQNEDNLVSSINKKSVKTLKTHQIMKELQKSKQISDKAEISKINSESDNFTEFDIKMKASMKLKKINDNNSNTNGIIGTNINEKEELENEFIDGDKDLITVLNNNSNRNIRFNIKSNNEENDRDSQLKKNNYFAKKENSINKDSLIENSGGNDLIESSSIKDNSNKEQKEKIHNIKKSSVNNLIDENISENKQLIPIIPILKKNNNISSKLLSTKEPEKDDISKKKQVFLNVKESTEIKNLLLNQNNIHNLDSNNNINIKENIPDESNRIFFRAIQNIQKDCYICEKTFYFIKLFYAECNIHYLCRKCLKSYYEDIIENKKFSKELKCPCAKCDKIINYEKVVKDIISETHQKIYESYIEKIGNIDCDKDKESIYDQNLKLYTKRHVLDINNNKNIYIFKKTKERYCPKCLMPCLFTKTNNNFIKCLFCNLKICKYCLKEFTPKHLNLQSEDHCKIRFRRNPDEPEQNKIIIKYLIEVFFVVVTYIFIYPGVFLLFLNAFNKCLKINNKNKTAKYYFKSFLSWIFCIIFFIVSCPFIIIIYSIFPSILAIFDY